MVLDLITPRRFLIVSERFHIISQFQWSLGIFLLFRVVEVVIMRFDVVVVIIVIVIEKQFTSL